MSTSIAPRSDALPVPGKPEEQECPVETLLPNLVHADRTGPEVVKFYWKLVGALQFLANFEEPTAFREILKNGSFEENSWIGLTSGPPIQEGKGMTLTLRGFTPTTVTFIPKSVDEVTGLPDGVTLYYGKTEQGDPFLALAQK